MSNFVVSYTIGSFIPWVLRGQRCQQRLYQLPPRDNRFESPVFADQDGDIRASFAHLEQYRKVLL